MSRKNGLIPILLEVDPTDCATTGYAGIVPYLDLWNALGMPTAVDNTVGICGSQGWMDRQMVQSLVLLNLIGGDCVTDIEKLEADGGLRTMVRSSEFSGMSLEQRRNASRRFRGGRSRTFSASSWQASRKVYIWVDAGKVRLRPPRNRLEALLRC